MPDFQTPLCELAYRYGSDKCPQIKHHYTLFYYALFKDRREQIKKVLEIGVGNMDDMRWTGRPYQIGASLFMWRDFFPNAQVFGADIRPECIFEDGRVKTFACDQSRPEELQWLLAQTGEDLDVVIDDGSHQPADQVLTCKVLMPMLRQDVIYAVEDVGHSEIAAQLSEYVCEFINPWRRKNRDDRILLVRKQNGKS